MTVIGNPVGVECFTPPPAGRRPSPERAAGDQDPVVGVPSISACDRCPWLAQDAHCGTANTYGFHRGGILLTLASSTRLALVSPWVFYEAYRPLITPAAVRAELSCLWD